MMMESRLSTLPFELQFKIYEYFDKQSARDYLRAYPHVSHILSPILYESISIYNVQEFKSYDKLSRKHYQDGQVTVGYNFIKPNYPRYNVKELEFRFFFETDVLEILDKLIEKNDHFKTITKLDLGSAKHFNGDLSTICNDKFLTLQNLIDVAGSVKHLNLYCCYIHNLINVTKYFKNLECLNLSKNINLRDFKLLPNLTHLKVLNLEYTGLERMSDLNGLTNLEELILSHNNYFTTFNLDCFRNLVKLSVTETRIEDLELSFCPNLELLNISNNPMLQRVTDVGHKLKNLNIDNCQNLHDLDIELFNLRKLSLMKCDSLMIKDLKISFKNLLSLKLSGTSISNLQQIMNFINLRELRLENLKTEFTISLNPILCLKELYLINIDSPGLDISQLTHLQKLVIDNFPLQDLVLKNSESLEILDLRNYALSNIKENQFVSFKNLKKLSLININLSNLPNLSQNTRLESLNLTRNGDLKFIELDDKLPIALQELIITICECNYSGYTTIIDNAHFTINNGCKNSRSNFIDLLTDFQVNVAPIAYHLIQQYCIGRSEKDELYP